MSLGKAADGKKIVLVEGDEELSPEQAAEFLHVSTSFLAKKLETGDISSHWVGAQRRILLSELLAYKQKRRERSRELLQQMREEAEELGLYE